MVECGGNLSSHCPRKPRYPCAALPSVPSSCAVWAVLAAGCVLPPRRSRALCGGCSGVLGGQAVQDAAAVVGGDGLLHKGLELFLGQRDGVGQQLLDKPHALAEAVRPVLALLPNWWELSCHWDENQESHIPP